MWVASLPTNKDDYMRNIIEVHKVDYPDNSCVSCLNDATRLFELGRNSRSALIGLCDECLEKLEGKIKESKG